MHRKRKVCCLLHERSNERLDIHSLEILVGLSSAHEQDRLSGHIGHTDRSAHFVWSTEAHSTQHTGRDAV